jgi:puromycin-sensitive aminopeptidase
MSDSSADASASHRLPYTVEPKRYSLHLVPDLEAATFAGDVDIDVVVRAPVTEIILNAAELAVSRAQFSREGSGPLDLVVHTDEETERLTLRVPGTVEPGPGRVTVEFTGVLNDKLHGFYRSVFTDEAGTEHVLATTQFEATDARRAFPCFDEPDRKAVFAITLDVADGLAAYSNGPAVHEEPLDGGGRRIRFAETILMSTYLVAFVVGPLVATEPVVVRRTPVRIVHAPGKGDLTTYALEVAGHALEFFSEWFGIEYPAEKLDLLAIPDFAFGAMENLGCVTFREALLLVDPARASRLELERVADVITHEIAHMWFGDLVTMRWWNGIWLNEAFATMMELLCVDAFRPQWQRWVSFGIERDVAMATDALHSTRPVEYPVGPPEEAQGMFDVLTYQKGAGVLRMLERYLGPDLFREGVRQYLDTHRFGNTETVDLWTAIERASGQPVRAIMDSWLLQGGFPLVTVEEPGDGAEVRGSVVLGQEAFAYAPADGPSAIGSTWTVPMIVRQLAGDEARTLLRSATEQMVVGDGGASTVVVNAHGSGYYRVRYSPARLRHLAERLDDLEVLERFNLLSDTWAVVVAGRADLDEFFVLAEALHDETDPDVWAQVTGALAFLDHALDDAVRPRLGEYGRALLAPVLRRVGWDPAKGEDPRTATLRAHVIGSLGVVGQDEEVRAEARRRFTAARTGKMTLDPDLTAAVLATVARAGGRDEFDVFVDRYRHPATPQEEMRYLYALAGFSELGLAARAFDMALTEVRSQNAPFLIQMLLSNRDTGTASWARLRTHWDEVANRVPANILPRMLDGVKLLCRDPELAAEIRRFVEAHPLAVGGRTVDQILERLTVNVAFATRLTGTAPSALGAACDRLAQR